MPTTVQGPDGKKYQFPDGTTKEKAVSYFKTKGIGVSSPADLEKRAMDPNAQYTPTTTSTGHTGEETQTAKNIEKGGKMLVGALPAIGGGLGAAAGGAVGALGGPGGAAIGAVSGATVGGAAGKNIENRFEGKDPHEGAAGAAVTQGAYELIGGQVVPKILTKIGKAAIPKVMKAMSNYIGLRPSDLPKWGRTANEADMVTHAVLDEAGVHSTLEAQRDAIEGARKAHDLATVDIVKAPGGKITDLHSVALDRAVKLLDEVEKEGVPYEKKVAIDKNLKGITDGLKEKMTPEELLTAKRNISSQITTWDRNTTNVRQRFLQGLYDDMNHAIWKALPADAAAEYRLHNLMQQRLIVAREAATEKLTADSLKRTPGVATKAVRGVVKPLVGAAIGATAGGMAEGKRGAVAGGLIGAGAGTVAEKLGSAELPVMDVKAQQAIAKAAPYLAKMSKKALPNSARAVQATIDMIRSGQDQ